MRRTGIFAGLFWIALSTVVLAGEGDADHFAAMLAADPLAGSVRLSRLGDEASPVIEALLESEDAPVRRGAALAAGRMGEEAADLRAALIALLADPDPAVRAAAVWALPRVSPAELPPELPATLGDPSEAVRLASSAAFEKYGEAALPELRKAISFSAPRAAALRAVTGLGGRQARWVLLGRLKDRREVLTAEDRLWFELAWASAGYASKLLRSEVPSGLPEELLQFRLRRTTGSINLPVRVIAALALSESSNIRLDAVLRLCDRWGSGGEEEALAALVLAFRDEDAQVRRAAAFGLAHVGPKGRVVLLEALGGTDPVEKRLAASVLDAKDDAIPALLEALVDPDPELRRIAAGSLAAGRGEKSPEVVIFSLIGRLSEPDPKVANQVANSLWGSVTWPEPALLAALDSENPEVRIRVLWILAQLDEGAVDALPEVRARLADADNGVRAAAANALAAISGDLDTAVPVLAEVLANGDRKARLVACRHIVQTFWRIDSDSYPDWDAHSRVQVPVGLALLTIYREETGDLFAAAAAALFDRNFDEVPGVDEELDVLVCHEALSEGSLSGYAMPMISGTFSGGRLFAWAAIRDLMRLDARDDRTIGLLYRAASGGDPVLRDWARRALRRLAGGREGR